MLAWPVSCYFPAPTRVAQGYSCQASRAWGRAGTHLHTPHTSPHLLLRLSLPLQSRSQHLTSVHQSKLSPLALGFHRPGRQVTLWRNVRTGICTGTMPGGGREGRGGKPGDRPHAPIATHRGPHPAFLCLPPWPQGSKVPSVLCQQLCPHNNYCTVFVG